MGIKLPFGDILSTVLTGPKINTKELRDLNDKEEKNSNVGLIIGISSLIILSVIIYLLVKK